MNIIDLIKSEEPLEPETLKQLYPELSDLEIQKLQAIKLIRDTKAPFVNFDIFENVIHILNNIEPDVDTTEGCKPEWLWYGLELMNKIKPLDLSYEVKQYILWNFKEYGLKFYPPLSGLKNDLLREVIYKAEQGPFPLKEEFLDIQALYYLKIQEYIKLKNKEK